MIKQYHSAQQRKTQAIKKLGDLWQHYSKLQEILGNSSGSKQWLRLTVIANQSPREAKLANRCLNHIYVNCLTKINQKSRVKKWYIFRDFQQAKKLLDNGCPQLEEGIDYEARGLKWYQGLVIPHVYNPRMDDCNHTNRLHTISPSVPPANHKIPIPPPSADISNMLPPPTPLTKEMELEMEKDGSNIGELLMNLAKDESGDGTSTPIKKDATPTNKEASMILPAPTDMRPVQFGQLPPRKRTVQPRQHPPGKRPV